MGLVHILKFAYDLHHLLYCVKALGSVLGNRYLLANFLFDKDLERDEGKETDQTAGNEHCSLFDSHM